MYKQSASDSPRAEESTTVVQWPASGQSHETEFFCTKFKNIDFFFPLSCWNQCSFFSPPLFYKLKTCRVASHKEILKSCFSTVSPCTFYQGILIFQLLCKGACWTISSRAYIFNLSVSTRPHFLFPSFPCQGNNIHRIKDYNALWK